MFTLIETPIFKRYADDIWTTSERLDFLGWLADNPLSGNVIPGSGGLRKVRWFRAGSGKRGGVRVIYYNLLADGVIWLIIVYEKSKFEDLPLGVLKQLSEEIGNGR